MPPSVIVPVVGSSGIWPDAKRKPPAMMAWLYGPIAPGASVVETGASGAAILGGLGDLIRPDAPRADPHVAAGPVHDGANPLEVRLEPAGGHVVGVAGLSAHHWLLPAHFTLLCHGLSFRNKHRSIAAFDGHHLAPLGHSRTETRHPRV